MTPATDRSARYYRSTLYHGLLQGISILVSLYLISFLLGRLGPERFGLWGALSSAFGFFLLADLGISSSFIHFFAKPISAGDRKGLWEEVTTGTYVYLVLLIVFLPVAFFILPWVLHFINAPEALRREAEGAYLFLLAAFAVRWLFTAYRSLLFAAERVDLLSMVGIGVTILQATATVWAIARGGGLVSLGAIAFVAAACAVSAELYLSHRLVLPFNSFIFCRPRIDVFLRQWRFGLKVQVVRLAETVHLHLDKLLLAHLVAISAVAFYDVGAKAASAAALLPAVFLPAVAPAVAQWSAAGQQAEVIRFYNRLMRWTVLIVFPLATLIILGSGWILEIWLGTSPPDSRMVEAVIWLTLGQAAYALTGPGRLAARGMGEPTEEMRAALFMAAGALFLNLPLIVILGFRGALLGTAGSMIIGSIYFLIRFHRRFGIPIQSLFQTFGVPAITSVFMILCVLALEYLL